MSQYCVLCYAWGMCLYIPLKVNPPGIIWSWLPAVAFCPYAYLGSTILSTDRPIFLLVSVCTLTYAVEGEATRTPLPVNENEEEHAL